VFTGTCHSVIVFFVPLFVFMNTIIDKNGTNADMWVFSITSFSSVIFVRLVWVNICLDCHIETHGV
jgi:hypothetical protein